MKLLPIIPLLLLLVACSAEAEQSFQDRLAMLEPPESYELEYTLTDSGYAGTEEPTAFRDRYPLPRDNADEYMLTMEQLKDRAWDGAFEPDKDESAARSMDCYKQHTPGEIAVFCFDGDLIGYYSSQPFVGNHRTKIETWSLVK